MHKSLIIVLVLSLIAIIAMACAPTPTPAPTAAPPTQAPAPTTAPATQPPAPTQAAEPKPADANTVLAVKAATAPKLDALADDAAWAKVPATTVKIAGGQNLKDGATTAILKAVYTADTVFFLLQYDDPTQSFRRSPFVKQPDGSWKKLTDPDDK